MIKCSIKLVMLMLPMQISIAAAETEVKADVQISVQEIGEIWAGQQLTLNLDLKTSGYSFSNTHFNLPEVSGAFLMQTDTTTVKLSEQLDGVNWQVIRYPLALYPQKPGQLTIPSIDVRFVTSAGFDSAEKAFEFKTDPIELSINTPPGLKAREMVISTASFELHYDWQPDSGVAATGDALTLTVTRQAGDISAMLLPSLPVFKADGLAVYPQAPELNDKTNRGDLTGERVDSIIWIIEKPGQYSIPGIRFQWWDPDKRQLKQQIIPGVELDIPLSATATNTLDGSETVDQTGREYFWILLLALIALATSFLWLYKRQQTQTQAIDSEKSAFRRLQQACKNNNRSQTYSALHAWLAWFSAGATFDQFAQICEDTRLGAKLEFLQEAVIDPTCHWQSGKLLNALQRNRIRINRQNAIGSNVRLAPLNP